jgi:hypothetical protein
LHGRRAFEGDLVEEAEGGDGLVVIAPGDVLLLDQVEEVGADLVGPEVLGGPAEVPREGGDAADVSVDGLGCEVSELLTLPDCRFRVSELLTLPDCRFRVSEAHQ